VDRLLAVGPKPAATPRYLAVLLAMAAANNDVPVVRALLRAGAHPLGATDPAASAGVGGNSHAIWWAARAGAHAALRLLIQHAGPRAVATQLNHAQYSELRSALGAAVELAACPDTVAVLLALPGLDTGAVLRAYDSGSGLSGPVLHALGTWLLAREAVVMIAAAAAGAGEDEHLFSQLDTHLRVCAANGLDAETLSAARDAAGTTALGHAAAGGLRGVIKALRAVGFNPLHAGDLQGTCIGTLARNAGHPHLAGQLHHTQVRAAAQRHATFRELRSQLVVANRVDMPRELIDLVLEFCVGDSPACSFRTTSTTTPARHLEQPEEEHYDNDDDEADMPQLDDCEEL
jgi:hypothetical protein